jgi:hypothetical protein
MKLLAHLIFFCLSLSLSLSYAQTKHYGLCNISVSKAYTQNILGKNVGYYVEFKNSGSSSCDAINWTAKFYNNFNDYKGSRKGTWSSGNFISPIKPGKITKELEGVWVTGATKVYITITRVHFTSGKSCGK